MSSIKLKNSSKKFRTFFLIEFAKQLVNYSKSEYVKELEKQKKELFKQIILEKTHSKQQDNNPFSSGLFAPKEIILTPIKIQNANILYSKLRIKDNIQRKQTFKKPEIKKAVKNPFGKIQQLINNKEIDFIVCNGPNKNIIIKKNNMRQQTSIVLNKEEIQEIIRKFFELAGISPQQGIIRAAFKNLMISGILSNVVDSKFIIQKV